MNKKAIISILLAGVMLFASCSSVGKTDKQGVNVTDVVSRSDVEVWSAPGTEKVLKDKVDGYENIKGEANIEVFAAKGEYEGVHLILTSREKDVSGIDFKAGDLTLAGDSQVVFPKENIEVFFEKYLEVKKVYEKNGASTGLYPDALVPMQSIVECDENRMAAGTNQGLYVRFNVPVEQPAGIYTGKMLLSFGGNNVDIPVRLEIVNLTVSQETHSRTYFISEWQYRLGELDSTQAMLEKYIEAGLEYRISPAGVVIDKTYDEEGIDFYVETAAKYMKNPKCTHIAIPFQSKTQTVNVNGEMLTANAFDVDVIKKVLNAFIEKSFEDNFDYVKKLGTHLVDEPQLNNALTRTKVVSTLFRQSVEEVASKLEGESCTDTALQAQLAESVRNIRAVITASYAPEYADYIDTWCPTVDYYDTEVQREKYAQQEEKWWYTCISPRTPFPTYHIEDTLLSARALSWMQAEYDVIGNLYWATNVYANYDGSKYVNIDDFFEGDASRFHQVNGDGFLFYPGKPYGIDGPIGSLRLEAIRDGLEEYEVLYALKKNYAALAEETSLDVNAYQLMRHIATPIYAGTRVSTTSLEFAEARRALYQLAMMSESGAKASVTNFYDDNAGNVSYVFYVADGWTISNNGEVLTDGQSVMGGKIYTVQNTLNQDVNRLNITISDGKETYSFNKLIGGKTVIYEAEKFKGSFGNETSDVNTALVDAATVDESLTGQLLKIDVKRSFAQIQRIAFKHEFINNLDAQTNKIVLNIYCEGLQAEKEELSLIYSAEKESGFILLSNIKVQNGWNTIEVSLAGTNFARDGSITGMYFSFKTVNAKTLYLKNIVVYNK